MDPRTVEQFRRSIEARRDTVVEWLRRAPQEERDRISNGVIQDGQSEATTVLAQMDHALARVHDGTFGRCDLCDDGSDVEEDRLALDFTLRVCLAHFSSEQVKALERDLELAAQLQQQLIPQWVPAMNGIQFATHASAGRIVGGDYFDFFRFRNDDQGAIIADVMGAGLPAGMLMSNLQASLRIVGPDFDAPDHLATRLNELFRYNIKLIRFISMVLVAFDPERNQIRYTNAGHNPPLLWRPSDGKHAWLRPTGPAIGLLPDAPFSTATVDTRPGDLLVLYTDGVVEAKSGDGTPFGEDRLLDVVSSTDGRDAEEVVSLLWQAVRHFSNGATTDDVAMLVARFL